jgi:hypothetical protein
MIAKSLFGILLQADNSLFVSFAIFCKMVLKDLGGPGGDECAASAFPPYHQITRNPSAKNPRPLFSGRGFL